MPRISDLHPQFINAMVGAMYRWEARLPGIELVSDAEATEFYNAYIGGAV